MIIRAVVLYDSNKEFEMHFSTVFSLTACVTWISADLPWHAVSYRWGRYCPPVSKRLMLGGDAYRVPSNVHFHVACITETCMPSRYTLKTLPNSLSLHRASRYKCFTIANRCTYLLVLESTRIYIKIYAEMLLHVSVYDHHQGACTWA